MQLSVLFVNTWKIQFIQYKNIKVRAKKINKSEGMHQQQWLPFRRVREVSGGLICNISFTLKKEKLEANNTNGSNAWHELSVCHINFCCYFSSQQTLREVLDLQKIEQSSMCSLLKPHSFLIINLWHQGGTLITTDGNTRDTLLLTPAHISHWGSLWFYNSVGLDKCPLLQCYTEYVMKTSFAHLLNFLPPPEPPATTDL